MFGTRISKGVLAAAAVVALALAATAFGASALGHSPFPGGMMGGANGSGMMGGANGSGMMGGANGSGMMGSWLASPAPQPGNTGFVPGTTTSPRVVHVLAGPGYTFSPSTIAVGRGETVTFVVTTMGPLVHEFMIGPAAAVAADQQGTPEVADIGMMQSKSITYTFDGSGPYAFACHATGHYEAGMHGTVTVVG